MAAKAKKQRTSAGAQGMTKESAEGIAELLSSHISACGSGATGLAVGSLGGGLGVKFGDGWNPETVVVLSPGHVGTPECMHAANVSVIPVLGSVRINDSESEIGSATDFQNGTLIALENAGEDAAAVLFLTEEPAESHADSSDGDESDDQLLAVGDVGKHGSG